MVNKGLSSHFQVSIVFVKVCIHLCNIIFVLQVQHTVSLNNEKSTYKFASTFVGSKQYSPTEVSCAVELYATALDMSHQKYIMFSFFLA